MKEKLKLLKIKLLLYGSLSAATMFYTSGCSSEKEPISKTQEQQEFDLNELSNLKLIKVTNSFGTENIYLTKTLELKDLNKYNDDKYFKYFTIKPFYKSTIYVDIFSGIVVTMKHIKEGETSYSFNTILNEENAYDYFSSVLGDKEYYSKEELKKILTNLSEKKLIKNNVFYN